jgi:hypothetical protein
MHIAPYIEKLHTSPEFNSFQKEHPDSYLVAGFFVLDYEQGKHVHQLDYYVPKEKKVAAFTLDKGIQMQLLSLMKAEVPEQLEHRTHLDLFALKGILEEEMKNRMISESLKKNIAVLQTIKGKKLWTINAVLSGMGILKAVIEDTSGTVLKMEKSSILDYVKKMPGTALNQAVKHGETKTGANLPTQEKAKLQHELRRLNELEQKIEEEKVLLKKEIGKRYKVST